jgi:hypothetical protein
LKTAADATVYGPVRVDQPAGASEVTDFAANLASTSSTSLGDALVGVKRTATGAVATTLHTWIERTAFNVKDFGAVGDGSTDDTTAIQAAITAAQTFGATAGGACVYVPASSSYYKITTRLLINANGITLMGDGAGSVIINTSTGNCLEVGDNAANRSDVHITQINLQATGANSIAIKGQKATNIRIHQCLIVNSGATADGIRLTDSFCATITENTLGGVKGYGIHASSSANAMYVAGNRLDGNSIASTCGIYIDGAGNTVKGNTVETWATCINIKSEKGGEYGPNYFETYVTGYLCDSSGAEGVTITGGYYAATGSTVSIKISAGNGYSIRGGSFVGTHSGGAPIELTSGPGDVTIYPGIVHDDVYVVKWPTNHIALGHHLLSDNLYPAEPGWLTATTHTGTTSETTILTYTGVKEHWGIETRIEVQVSGRCTGTAGQKDIRLKLAGTTIATISEAAGATDDWLIKAEIDIQSATVAVGTVLGFQGAAVELFDYLQGGVTIALSTTNPTITVTGQLGNSADSIVVQQWKVQVIN